MTGHHKWNSILKGNPFIFICDDRPFFFHFFSRFFSKNLEFFQKKLYTPRFFFSKFCQKIWNSGNFLATPEKKFGPPKKFLATPKKILTHKIFLATPKKICGAKNFWVPPEIFRFKGNSLVFEFCLVWRLGVTPLTALLECASAKCTTRVALSLGLR